MTLGNRSHCWPEEIADWSEEWGLNIIYKGLGPNFCSKTFEARTEREHAYVQLVRICILYNKTVVLSTYISSGSEQKQLVSIKQMDCIPGRQAMRLELQLLF
ncbi:hypothetical protein CapIbe_001455 [Capra ibex]